MRETNGSARFIEENYGDSSLARRFGITRYPAIFVNDVLVATPNDFGWFGKGEEGLGGRYAPLKSAESHERLRADLARMIALLAEGKEDEARAAAHPAPDARLARLPSLTVRGLAGESIAADGLLGRVVLVEFWATWCPPCRGTLQWLGGLKRQHGDAVAVVTLAVQSDEAKVRTLSEGIGAPILWAMCTPEVARAFGDVGAVPTLFLFDRAGTCAGTYFGAPPTLHAEVAAKIEALLR